MRHNQVAPNKKEVLTQMIHTALNRIKMSVGWRGEGSLAMLSTIEVENWNMPSSLWYHKRHHGIQIHIIIVISRMLAACRGIITMSHQLLLRSHNILHYSHNPEEDRQATKIYYKKSKYLVLLHHIKRGKLRLKIL